MVVVLQAVFVPYHLSVEFVHQLVDGGVHVFVRLLNKDVAAFDVQGDLCFLPSFFFFELFNPQLYRDVYDLIKVPGHTIQLCEYVLSQCGSDFKVMSADRQVHQNVLFEGGNTPDWAGTGKIGRAGTVRSSVLPLNAPDKRESFVLTVTGCELVR